MKGLFGGRRGEEGGGGGAGRGCAFKKERRIQTQSDFRRGFYWRETFKRGRAFIGGFTVLITSFAKLTLIRVGFLGGSFCCGKTPPV